MYARGEYQPNEEIEAAREDHQRDDEWHAAETRIRAEDNGDTPTPGAARKRRATPPAKPAPAPQPFIQGPPGDPRHTWINGQGWSECHYARPCACNPAAPAAEKPAEPVRIRAPRRPRSTTAA